MPDFDSLFLNLPQIKREHDFSRFWDDSIRDNKKALEAEMKPLAHKNPRFDSFDLSFASGAKTRVSGTLHIPKATEKPHPVIIIHDYVHTDPYKGFPLDEKLAYFFLKMRGHQHLKVVVQENAQGAKTVQKRILPGYLEERILEPEKYYVKNIYLDALKSIDALRLNRKLDCGSVAVIGKGLGAAAAIFTAAYSSRVSAIVIDSPSFSYLDESQNESRGEIAEEITGYIERNPTKRNVVKRSLSYFDALAFTDRVKCPVMFSIGLKDDIAPPQCSFALFNHLICDKEIQVYPDEGNEAGGEKQFKKALRWIKSQISPTE